MNRNEQPRRSGPGRLSAEDAAGLADRLLDAATEQFATKGYSGTTMEAISKAAGASTKTVYSRYTNKAEMLHAVVQRLIDRTLAQHAVSMAVDPAGSTPRAFLLDLGRRFATVISTPQGAGINRLALSEAFRFPELARFYVEGLGRGIALVENALLQWQEAGLMPSMPKAHTAATLFIGMITDRPRIRAVIGKPLSADEIETHVATAVEVFLRGCGHTGK